ncbi:MAG: ArsB/NhaD family transporter, partial [Candidatus Gastranaerophilaceae bacterium]
MFLHGHELLISGLILVVSYIFIAFEIIPKMTIALFGASLTLLLGLIPHDKVFGYIDFKVIFLLVSMMVIVNIAKRSGMFNWFAIELLKKADGRPFVVLFALATFTAVLSAFLDNMTAVILVIPITFIIAREFMIDPVPFFITEIIASNIGGTATLIGDPPNIIIGSRAGLSFMDFVRELTPVVIVIYFVSMAILLFMFRKKLVVSPHLTSHINDLDNSKSIKDKKLMIRSTIVLVLVIIGFVLHSLIHIDAYVIALTGASFLLLFETSNQALRDIEWVTISFFIGLFIIIGGFEASGGIHLLAQKLLEVTHGSTAMASMLILWLSGLFSAIIDNIPYTATMAPLISNLQGNLNIYPLWWSLSLGACLGGNATIIGAAANVIVSETAYA